MRIDELDEYQGLEAQMVRDWLTSKGCYRQDGPWRHPTAKYSYTDGEYGGLLWEDTLFKLSVDFELASVQALLREINPRMRKGMPSQSALAASSHWLVLDNETQEIALYRSNGRRLHVARAPFELMPDFGDFVSYWPCDEHGNKVRWPTDANGAML